MGAQPGKPSGESVEALAAVAGGTAEGETGRLIQAVAPLESATEHDVVFADSERALKRARESRAGCIVVGEGAEAGGRTVIRARNPKLAFARVVERFHPQAHPAPGIHPTAIVDPSARLAEGVHVGAYAIVGARAEVGPETVIGAACVLGEGVRLSPSCFLYPRVTMYPGTNVGARVILHSGVVLGSDGFGYAFDGQRYEKFPQVGTLEIGDDVEVGANSTIDRGALGATLIGRGTKIDNLVQVAHNVTIGEHCVIAAQTGISGSVVIEPYAVIGGQVGIADHVRIERGAVLGAQSGVPSHKIIRRGQTVWGTPARPIKDHLEQLATLARLTKRG